MRLTTRSAGSKPAGHESILTTERYMHLSAGSRERAIALLNGRGATREQAENTGTAEVLTA